jgi:hypothetical protein
LYTKLALGLCLLGVLVLVGAFVTLPLGGEEIPFENGHTQAKLVDDVGEDSAHSASSQEQGEDPDGETASSGETPPYEVLRKRQAEEIREIDIKTTATREKDMRPIVENLRSYTPKDGILLLEFLQGTESRDLEPTGFALVFDSREAAAAPYLTYTEEEEEAIFSEDGGIKVTSYEEFKEEHPDLVDRLGGMLLT